MAIPPPEEAPKKRGSGWKWLFALAGCGCLLAVGTVVALAVGLGAAVNTAVRSHPGYELALETAQTSPTLIELIGEPIEPSAFQISSSMRSGDGSGEAEFRFPVSGPSGSGKLDSQAIQKDGVWQLTKLTFDPAGTKPLIDLLERDAAIERGDVEEDGR